MRCPVHAHAAHATLSPDVATTVSLHAHWALPAGEVAGVDVHPPWAALHLEAMLLQTCGVGVAEVHLVGAVTRLTEPLIQISCS